MFWGLVLEPGKRYTQTVERAFHVSMACLEANAVDTDIVSVVLEDQAKKQFILCNLHKQKVIQAQLDLNFQSGDVLSFSATGKGKVHLTGYLLEPDEDEDEEDESDANDLSLEELENLTKDIKTGKRKKGSEGATPDLKKPKIDTVLQEVDDSDEDDEDYEVGVEDKESGDDVDDEEDDEEEEGDDDEEEDKDDDDEEEEDDDDDDDTEEKEDDVVTPQPKVVTPQPKKKQDNIKTPNKQKNNAQNEKQEGKTPKTPKTPQVNGNQQSGKKNKKESPKSKTPVKKALEGGVIIEETTEGHGVIASRGKQVSVYYVGRLLKNNKHFDSTTQGPGFKFRLGRGEVIRGWDIGVAGMKVGGKRKITCPAAMAYGVKGSPPVVPPNSTLVFDVELKGVSN